MSEAAKEKKRLYNRAYSKNRTPEQREAYNAVRRARKRPRTEKQRAADNRRGRAYTKRWGVSPSKVWRQNHPNHVRSLNGRYAGLLGSARIRDVAVSLTKEQYAIVVAAPCYYCGGPLPRRGHGVDRIDNTQGYVLGNVRPCCSKCNRAKHTMSEEEFKNWLQQVTEHWLMSH